jgi:hypothetical protein
VIKWIALAGGVAVDATSIEKYSWQYNQEQFPFELVENVAKLGRYGRVAICGNSGLGKSPLMCAVLHRLSARWSIFVYSDDNGSETESESESECADYPRHLTVLNLDKAEIENPDRRMYARRYSMDELRPCDHDLHQRLGEAPWCEDDRRKAMLLERYWAAGTAGLVTVSASPEAFAICFPGLHQYVTTYVHLVQRGSLIECELSRPNGVHTSAVLRHAQFIRRLLRFVVLGLPLLHTADRG